MKENNKDDSRRQPKKSTKIDRIIDDFVGKRYGNGEFFYGKRTSDMSEEDYQELKSRTDPQLPDEDSPMAENAVLIVGGLDHVGQWVAFDLAEKGFKIRVTGENFKDAVKIFGLPGFNVDIIVLTPSSSEERFARAIEVSDR